MTDTEIVMLIVAAVFLLIGVVTAVTMGRRGHDPWTWGVLGALFGPLVIPLVVVRRRGDDRAAEKVLRSGRTGSDPAKVSVVVGVDGSPEALAATSAVVALLGDRLGSLTLATVLDLDAVDALHAQPDGHSAFERDARAVLDAAAARVAGVDPATVILGGRAADALLAYARDHDVDLIAIGTRGSGLSEAVLGSVAERLIREPGVLLLVAGREVVGEQRPPVGTFDPGRL